MIVLAKNEFKFIIIPNQNAIVLKYGIVTFPTTMILDTNGKVVWSTRIGDEADNIAQIGSTIAGLTGKSD